jgi:hypothetical protein
MYDFYFGELDEILANEEKYLLFIKRMMPRWTNGIPDAEYIAIYDILKSIEIKNKKPVLVETGSGASSLTMLYYAIKNDGILYTWDPNGSKGSFLRSVANDTICKSFRKCLHDHWKFIEYSSVDEYLGIQILKELDEKVDFAFFDSLHTLDNLLQEIALILECMNDIVYLSIDDANYTNKSKNIAYINLFRKKIGLPPVIDKPDNLCRAYYLEVEDYLKKNSSKVEKIRDSYKDSFKEDIFLQYYNIDKKITDNFGMEKLAHLEHRFDAWTVFR